MSYYSISPMNVVTTLVGPAFVSTLKASDLLSNESNKLIAGYIRAST